ncbi:hypothetical protein Kpol_1050p57 [Vanderwaltozyma polyspora DSM 70294]|uniref:TECPR1-like DysF domain-containing protein n=1 Tax=Vanderwaltozyma polyspora (strain ATCC 22028 / DSM 70294 / BCRC 21397 / CBS 2163 / NBRC 10782 / NRRL Y-8283 / UCD 57-17) TaxID=436907 RepID=A7TEV3_VANPO|nr:uncharacterized protein Kpol_1050p57 [Vanderwaltozyma polyspora DSM 70294]EDO19199.1 hypothetical protein Kpol_1050p57 [Vanderwaltozyma polyspora DSM 70294]
MSEVSEKGLIRHFFTRRYEKIVDSLIVNEIEDTASNSNRDLIHTITASLINASIEKYKRDKSASTDASSDQGSESSDSFWKDENFKQEYELDTPPSTSLPEGDGSLKGEHQPKEHFLDIFVDKLISKIVPEKLPEREQFSERVLSPDLKKHQPISASTLGRNMGKLGSKMTAMFDMQETVIRLITWRNPSGTVTLLISMTMLFYNPIILLLLPLVTLMYMVMIPGYIHRHPLHRAIYPSRTSYGRSLLEDIASSGPSNAWYPNNTLVESLNELQSGDSGATSNFSDTNSVSHSMAVVMNLRDVQNITTSLVQVSQATDKFIYGAAGFKDERRSTILFFTCFLATGCLWALAPYINWSFFFSFNTWLILICIHPNIREHLLKLMESDKVEEGRKALEKKERYDVILDEKPEVKHVEIFEILEQGITPHHWKFYKFSNQVFDPHDQYRKLQQPPPGVDNLKDIEPPRTWYFDENAPWEVDPNAKKWSEERGLNLTISGQYLVDDQFKRRRLTRRVLRFARPANKPQI